MATLGHDVVGIDVDVEKIAALNAGIPPFFEPGFPEILREALDSGRLSFSSTMASAAGAEVHFLAVGTPQSVEGDGADLSYVFGATRELLPHLSAGNVLVGKSTVPVGTAEALQEILDEAETGATVAWNPEFLREGFAVGDTLHPDRIVYGLAAGERGQRAKAQLDAVYASPLADGTPLIPTDFATAELVKVAANAFLATKISFINAMSEIADVVGADVTDLADAIGHDNRIGRRFLNAGVGFGGGCLPKDIRAFATRADELGVGSSLNFLREVDSINLRQRERVAALALAQLGTDPTGKRAVVLGLAFKPNSDDMRDSPALDVALRLHDAGVNVVSVDPAAVPRAQQLHPQLTTTTDINAALTDAEVVVLATEWPEFVQLDPTAIHARVKTPTIIDARNALAPSDWREAGWTYIGLGRP
ncbi:UDPglucose 6-dehydrogenase [Lysinibacter cavernae]|uniref:UDP-glucose 6-dehydrogenase n=2 Tax=Lysinibacter cavernae TaxID=1640652 RepID=A0A7X5TUA8_9MICO|nr:UDPglucose 6-dehydrogenase [Lysinibacter cavernae]